MVLNTKEEKTKDPKFVKGSKLYYRTRTEMEGLNGETLTDFSKWIECGQDLELGSLKNPSLVYEFKYFIPQKNKSVFKGFFN